MLLKSNSDSFHARERVKHELLQVQTCITFFHYNSPAHWHRGSKDVASLPWNSWNQVNRFVEFLIRVINSQMRVIQLQHAGMFWATSCTAKLTRCAMQCTYTRVTLDCKPALMPTYLTSRQSIILWNCKGQSESHQNIIQQLKLCIFSRCWCLMKSTKMLLWTQIFSHNTKQIDSCSPTEMLAGLSIISKKSMKTWFLQYSQYIMGYNLSSRLKWHVILMYKIWP